MTSPSRRRLYVVGALAVAVIAGIGGGVYYDWQRSRLPKPPEIRLDGLDHEVAEAINAARKAVTESPESADAWGDLGLVLFAHSLYPEALQCFTQAETLNAQDMRWPYYQALVHILGEMDQALPALDRAIAIDPRNFVPRLRRAETLLQQERFDDAQAAFEEVLARQPNHPRAFLGLGMIAARRGKLAEATPMLLPLVNEPTCRRAARSTLADVYARRGKTDESDANRRAADALPPDAPWSDPHLIAMEERQVGLMALLQRSDRLIGTQQYEQAKQLLAKIIRSHPEADEAHLNLGRVHLAMGDPDLAEQALRDAIRIAPKTATAHFLLGAAMFQRGRLADAEAGFRAAIELKPDYAIAHFNLGNCRLRQNDADGALASFREAIRYRANFFEAQLAAGALLLERGDKKAARPFLENAVRLNPEHEKAKKLLKDAESK